MRSRWTVIVIACAGLIGLALLWRYTPLANAVQPDRLAAWLERFSNSPWGPLIAVALFVAAGFVMMPVLLLITATALVFEPFVAVAISLSGSLLSSAGVYGVGAKFVRGGAHKAFGPAVERVRKALHSRGVISIAAIRMLPIAPFGVVNLAAGSIGVRFWDFLLGTALGLAPGIVVLSVFGRQVRELWQQPTVRGALTVVGVAVGWVLLSVGLQRLVSRRAS
jgi:phospholipase D1/2